MPQGIIKSKYPKSVFILSAKPCIVTQREALTPIAHIFRAKGVPTSNQTPVSPSERSAFSPYSDKVRITISSKKRRYLCMSVKKLSKSKIGYPTICPGPW